MAAVTGRAIPGAGLPGLTLPFALAVLAAPAILGIAHALPGNGAGLAVRLTAAAVIVLVLPGALIVRAVAPTARPALALAAAVPVSLAVCFLTLALTFAAGGSLSLAVAIFAVLATGALLASLRAESVSIDRTDLWALAVVLLLGAVACGVVWWAAGALSGQELYDLARVRKLDSAPELFSNAVVDEFRDGGPAPDSAFPLWHGLLALVARLAGVDPAGAVQHLGGLLVPLALGLAYAAGRELFGTVAGGLATALAQLALVSLPGAGGWTAARLAEPAVAALLLLVPVLLALVFAWVSERRPAWLVLAAVASLCLASVRISYAAFVAIGLAGFALARLACGREGRADAGPVALALAAVLVPAGLYFAWLSPVALDTNAFLPATAYRTAAVRLHDGALTRAGGLFALEPGQLAHGGAPVVVGLLAVAVAAVAVRNRFGSFVVGATLAVAVVALVPPLFRPFSDVLTLTEAMRIGLLLPLPFALAGLATVAAARRRAALVPAAALGAAAVAAFGSVPPSGPAWPVWVAVAGCLLALALRPTLPGVADRRATLAVAVALTAPLIVGGLVRVDRDRPDPRRLPAGLVAAVRELVPVRAVVLADLGSAYRLSAEAPVTVVGIPPARAAATGANEPRARAREVAAVLYAEKPSYLDRARILARRGASWLLVDRDRGVPAYVRFLPAPVVVEGSYALYDLRRRSEQAARPGAG